MKYLVAIVIIFGFGVLMGAKTASPDVEFVEGRTKTVYVDKPAETVIETETPQACLDALRYAVTINDEADGIYSRGTEQLDIISEARKAIAGSDDTAPVNNRQNRLTSKLNGNLSRLSEAFYNFQIADDNCEAASE